MKFWKRILAVSLAAVLCLPAAVSEAGTAQSGGRTASAVVMKAAGTVDTSRYFYQQLTPEAKKFYDALTAMQASGALKKGTDYDLVAGGKVTQAQLAAYAGGDTKLLEAMGAARDAFQYDNPDVFYVDYSAVSIRVSLDSKGTYHAHLGTGRKTTYLLPGFETEAKVDAAVKEYDAKVKSIADTARAEAQKASSGDSASGDSDTALKREIGSVHDQIVYNMIYRYEDEVSRGNARTAYDALVIGEGVCEAYTRGFKAVMDELGIPCICVYGVYKISDTMSEEHIWNYVQVDGKWYGVDATHDDPVVRNSGSKRSGRETREYFLVGEVDLAAHHIASGILSPANYEFSYPALELEALRGKEYVDENNGFRYEVQEAFSSEGDISSSGCIYVSYNGKNYTQNAAEGKYILARFLSYQDAAQQEGTGSYTYTDWAYIEPKFYAGIPMESAGYTDDKLGSYLKFLMPQIKMAQFAVTDIAPKSSSVQDIKNGGLYYKGDSTLLTIKTAEIENKWGSGYIAPPYPAKATPYMSGKLTVGKTYNMSVTYDQDMTTVSETPLNVKLVSTSADRIADNATGSAFAEIANVHFDGRRTLTFQFTPSMQYADDCCFYDMEVEGLVSEQTQQVPVHLTYFAGYECAAYAYKSEGIDWNIFGQPQLLENTDVNTSGWTTKDLETGEVQSNVSISDKVTHRLTLVTTEPSPAQSRELMDTLEHSKYGSDQVLESNTYNIRLTLCKQQIVRTGESLRVCVGFPKGFNYDSSLNGVTFKAYHYIVDPKTNLVTGVEEIPVTVTPYGLIMLVDSFSPFTVTAVKSDGKETDTKTVVLGSSTNGKLLDDKGNTLRGAKGIITLKEHEEKTITIRPESGYEIDEIAMNGTPHGITNDAGMKLTLKYDELGKSTLLNVRFASAKLHQTEDSRGESHVLEAAPADIEMPAKVTFTPGGTLTISPTVTVYGGTHSYQWYKDGKKISGKTGQTKNLSIKSAKAGDAGEYSLKVTTSFDGKTACSEGSCTASVKGQTEKTWADQIAGTGAKTKVMKKNTVPKKGSTLQVGKVKYKITKAAKKNGTVSFVSTKSKSTKITVPAAVKINGITFKVTSIAGKAFANNKKLKSVTIGKNVTSIGAQAFYKCTALTKVSIPAKTTSIGNAAFYKCTKLTKISIPAKVGKIGKQAFYGCKKLKSITIRTTTLSSKKVGSKAFSSIYAKAVIKVPKKKLSAYKKLLKSRGIGSKVKVKAF